MFGRPRLVISLILLSAALLSFFYHANARTLPVAAVVALVCLAYFAGIITERVLLANDATGFLRAILRPAKREEPHARTASPVDDAREAAPRGGDE